jgi:hypothetical protein
LIPGEEACTFKAADAVVEVCAAHAASGCYRVWIAKEKREERSLRQDEFVKSWGLRPAARVA